LSGAVKLSSDCPNESLAARYLFVKSIFGFIFWGIMAVLGFKQRLIPALSNPFVEGYMLLEAIFSFIWFIVGKFIYHSRLEPKKVLCNS